MKILSIVLLGLILRLIYINQSLWLDEAININAVKFLDYYTLVANYSLGDFHPPLYHIVLKGWTSIFGFSEIASRMPSVIFGTASLYILYLLVRNLYDAKTGLIASLLLATSPLHIYYSQEARMYMLAAFLALLTMYFFVLILKHNKLHLWVGFILSLTLTLYTDYLPYLLIPTIAFFAVVNRKNVKKNILFTLIPAIIISILLLTPWLYFLPSQLDIGLSVAAASPAWAQVVGSSSLVSLVIAFVKFTIGRISHTNNLIYVLVFAPAGIAVSVFFLLSLFRISRERSIIYFWFFTPLILGFIISSFIPVFSYFRFIFILPAFYIIWASAINTISIGKIVKSLLLISLSINLVSLSIFYLNPRFHREDWKNAAAFIYANATDSTKVLFLSSEPFTPFSYYNLGRVPSEGILDGFAADKEKLSTKIEKIATEYSHVYLFQYLSEISDPQGIAFNELTNQGYSNTSTVDFNGVGFVYEFKR